MFSRLCIHCFPSSVEIKDETIVEYLGTIEFSDDINLIMMPVPPFLLILSAFILLSNSGHAAE